ncbi:hypothetical protein S245_030555, partial [Arachis hypogaea]
VRTIRGVYDLLHGFDDILQQFQLQPTFLQRCLDYKIEAKQQKRIQLIALLGDIDETQALFPLYICLTRVASKDEDAKSRRWEEPNREFRSLSMLLQKGRNGCARESNVTEEEPFLCHHRCRKPWLPPSLLDLHDCAIKGQPYLLGCSTGKLRSMLDQLKPAATIAEVQIFST